MDKNFFNHPLLTGMINKLLEIQHVQEVPSLQKKREIALIQITTKFKNR
jgi:hypothetical protein